MAGPFPALTSVIWRVVGAGVDTGGSLVAAIVAPAAIAQAEMSSAAVSRPILGGWAGDRRLMLPRSVVTSLRQCLAAGLRRGVGDAREPHEQAVQALNIVARVGQLATLC